jgi:uncharacterized MAPEG superfamily protein
MLLLLLPPSTLLLLLLLILFFASRATVAKEGDDNATAQDAAAPLSGTEEQTARAFRAYSRRACLFSFILGPIGRRGG